MFFLNFFLVFSYYVLSLFFGFPFFPSGDDNFAHVYFCSFLTRFLLLFTRIQLGPSKEPKNDATVHYCKDIQTPTNYNENKYFVKLHKNN